MNVFESEIAKYERRVANIGRRPSPNMLKSNSLLYQAQLEGNRELLKAWQDGKSFVATNGGGTVLMQCFGDFYMLNLVRIADRLGTKQAEAAFDKVRAMGFPEYPCDRTLLFLPLAAMGEELPKPSIIYDRTTGCEVTYHTKIALAHSVGIPLFSVDIPFEDPYQQHLAYVTRQMKELVDWVEATLPGAKYDEAKLVKWQKDLRRWYGALHDIYELRKHVPCPDHPRDVFREPVYPGQFSDPEMLLQYYEMYREELQDRVKAGYTPVGEEKLRIVWSITGPYGSNIWDYLAKRGVSVPYWHYGGADRVFTKPAYGDLTDFGRELTPLEEEARIALYKSWAGCG
ncbi:MAG: 2-hydroxyacyl-CoA dehydratase, partial [Chloroflexi bacterium]|nr:2-hydroxyacyl-CoA dehydratase [Chloroflexota bacterium]